MSAVAGPGARLGRRLFSGRTAVLATMHGKQAAIAPVLEEALGLRIEAAVGLDTDRFGTFTGEVSRVGTQREAARAKAETALSLTGADLAIASEGSFGPHPVVPFARANRELVLLLDRREGLELAGHVLTTATNLDHAVVSKWEEALAFADRVGFPDHGLVVRLGPDARGSRVLARGIVTPEALEAALAEALHAWPGGVVIETDMRAHVNPTRMRAIRQAAEDLVRLVDTCCPACDAPGFDVTAVVPGLPCAWCRLPTALALAHVLSCGRCGREQRRAYPDGETLADPGRCEHCNP